LIEDVISEAKTAMLESSDDFTYRAAFFSVTTVLDRLLKIALPEDKDLESIVELIDSIPFAPVQVTEFDLYTLLEGQRVLQVPSHLQDAPTSQKLIHVNPYSDGRVPGSEYVVLDLQKNWSIAVR
jgi:hypothetical protein